MVYAVRKGSFAIKEIELKNNGEDIQTVKMNTANIQTAEYKNIEDGFSDYAVIEITGNSKEDLIEKIKEAQELLDNTPNASDSKKNALQEAINKAQELVNDSAATEDDYTQGVAALNKAMESE